MSSVAIIRGDELLLFDAGEGTQRAFLRAGIGLNRKTRIFITHLHGDHCIGVLGLLQTMSLASRDKPVDIYGPRGLAGFIKSSQKYLRFGLTFDVRITEVRPGNVFDCKEYSVCATLARHSVTSFSYCLEEKERPGIFYPEKAKKFRVPEGILWSSLQHGNQIRIGRRIVRPVDVLGPPRRGRKIGISGDTRPSTKLRALFKYCDVLIFESTYGDDHRDKAIENLHSTAREAAQLAKQAGVRQLVLTHFSARYPDVTPLVKQAREVHDDVIPAEDLMSLQVPYLD